MESIQNAILRGLPADWFPVALLLFIILILIVYLLLFLLRIALHKDTPSGESTPMSLILTFRNEEDNLRNNLEPVLAGLPANFEVVAVDNCSQDNSVSVLNALKSDYPNLKISSLKQDIVNSGKMAQNIALKAASHDWVSFISTAIELPGTNWVHEISSRLGNGSQVVVSYTNIKPQRSFMNVLFRTEMFLQQIKSYAYIKNGLSYVANQENAAFVKQLYFNEGGYRGKISEPFTNLEPVINSFMRKVPVTLNISAGTSYLREERVTAKDFVELVKKEASIKEHLPLFNRIIHILFEWSYLLAAPVGAVVVYRIPETWPYIAGLLTLLALCYLLIIKKMLSRLQEFKLFLPSFLMAPVLPYIKLLARIRYFRYGEKKEWKIRN